MAIAALLTYDGFALNGSGYSAQIAYTFGRSIDNDSEPFGGGAGELLGSQEVDNIAPDVYRFIHAWPPVHDVQ